MVEIYSLSRFVTMSRLNVIRNQKSNEFVTGSDMMLLQYFVLLWNFLRRRFSRSIELYREMSTSLKIRAAQRMIFLGFSIKNCLGSVQYHNPNPNPMVFSYEEALQLITPERHYGLLHHIQVPRARYVTVPT